MSELDQAGLDQARFDQARFDQARFDRAAVDEARVDHMSAARLRTVVLDDYQGVASEFADWSLLDSEVVMKTTPIGDDQEFEETLREADVIVAMRERTAFTAERFALLPKLQLLVTTGQTNASIDLDAAREHGVIVCGTESLPSPTPELTWGLILSLLRNIPHEHAAVQRGDWQSTVGGDLAGRRLGIVGLGRLGKRVAEVGAAFGMDVVAWSQQLDDAAAAEVGVRAVSKAELFETSDVITVHYKLSERSRAIVGASDIARMKPTAVLINTSRGPLIDTDALVAALVEGRIGGAGLDVYDLEPLPTNHPLRTAPHTVLTPHLGYVTTANYRIFYGQAVEAIVAWRAGAPIRRLV